MIKDQTFSSSQLLPIESFLCIKEDEIRRKSMGEPIECTTYCNNECFCMKYTFNEEKTL